MTRRTACQLIAGTLPALKLGAAQHEPSPGIEIARGPFEGTRASLGKYEVPEWFRDAKFGIWAHWGPQSAIEYGDWYARNMYIDMLVDIVSRNGNLMLNFPLPARGTLDLEELNVLAEITKWMSVNSGALYRSRPWKIFGEGPAAEAAANTTAFNENKRKDLTAADVRFTTKGDTLYAFVMGWPEFQTVIRPLATNTGLRVGKIQNVELLGLDGKLDWAQDSSGLKVMMPAQKPCDYAIVFKVTGAIAG
jgi:alpha-L-fucosidase